MHLNKRGMYCREAALTSYEHRKERQFTYGTRASLLRVDAGRRVKEALRQKCGLWNAELQKTKGASTEIKNEDQKEGRYAAGEREPRGLMEDRKRRTDIGIKMG